MDKKIIIGIVAFLILLIGVGGFFYFKSQNSGNDEASTEEVSQTVAKKVSAEEIGLTLTPTQNNQVIMMSITKLSGIESLDYEVTYDAIENGETVERGAIGTVELKGESSIDRKIDLGTCSRNVCKYDKGVKSVKFVLRINYKDGSVGEVNENVTF
jgi:hypothetical protein